FRGMNPADMEIGMGYIRPGFTKSVGVAAGGDVNADWNVTLTGMGALQWVNWLAATGTSGFALSEDFGLIITHLVSQISPNPLIRHIHFQIGRINLIPEEVSDIMIADNTNQVAVFPIPTKIVLPEDELQVTVEGYAGVEVLKLGGLVIGLGRILKVEDLVTLAWI
ncbi:unnamed protein product, partial [marine sediment metagenome]